MSFDPVATSYQTLERMAFGDSLHRCRIACLDEIGPPGRTMLVGEGNGRFLCELLRRYPDVEIDCVDSSWTMLQLARDRVEAQLHSGLKRVRFLHHDIKTWDCPEHRYDLVVTHFFLDCFPEPVVAGIIEKLAHAATAGATWLLADFRVPQNRLARLHASVWLRAMYLFFRITTRIEARRLADLNPFLRAQGFDLDRQHLFRSGMLKSELWRRRLETGGQKRQAVVS